MKANLIISPQALRRPAIISVGHTSLEGELEIPEGCHGVVIFAHGSGFGSSRHCPHNQFVAQTIREAGLGTLTFDYLTPEEERQDSMTWAFRFNVALLASRLVSATLWLDQQPETRGMTVGYFGASAGGGAAMIAAAELKHRISAIVSGGGRPDLSGKALHRVKCPTLLLVGGDDKSIIALNESAFPQLGGTRELRIVPDASHFFEGPGKLEQMAHLSAQWFNKHMGDGCHLKVAA